MNSTVNIESKHERIARVATKRAQRELMKGYPGLVPDRVYANYYEDAQQEALLKVWEVLTSGRDLSNPNGYAYIAARNEAKRVFTKAARGSYATRLNEEDEHGVELVETIISSDSTASALDVDAERLACWVGELSEEEQFVIDGTLNGDGTGQKCIAADLGVSIRQVQVIKRRAMDRLQEIAETESDHEN